MVMDAANTILNRFAQGLEAAKVAEVIFGNEGPSNENELVAKCDLIFKEMATHIVIIYWTNGENTWNIRNMKALRAHYHRPPKGNKIIGVARLSIRELNKHLPQE